jgi:trans-aconitate 2-methyltransferase
LRVDAWETTYLHLLSGPDPVLEWVKGTGLRPILAQLDDDDRAAFLAEYGALLRRAYPVRADGCTPFPFRRVFVVTHRP